VLGATVALGFGESVIRINFIQESLLELGPSGLGQLIGVIERMKRVGG
jgi:hypothetical protein